MTEDETRQITGPKLSLEIAREMDCYDCAITKTCCSVVWDDYNGGIPPLSALEDFNPHYNLNAIRKIWEWMFKQNDNELIRRYLEHLFDFQLDGSIDQINIIIAFMTKTPEEHCHAFLLAAWKIKKS